MCQGQLTHKQKCFQQPAKIVHSRCPPQVQCKPIPYTQNRITESFFDKQLNVQWNNAFPVRSLTQLLLYVPNQSAAATVIDLD